MKAMTFVKPLEYTLEAEGEKWQQGATIKGTLKVKNHSTENVEIRGPLVTLSEGHYKRIKAKEKNAWKVLSTIKLDESFSIKDQDIKNYSFEFHLPQDCLITDKGGSLYLAFFEGSETWPIGHIELVVGPKMIISQILEIFENFLRFKVTHIKSAKGAVEVKLTPPTSRDFSTIDSLILNIAEVDENLTLKYLFNVRVLDMTGATMQAQKKTKELEQKFNSKQYFIYGESLNQDFILESLTSVLNEVKPKFL